MYTSLIALVVASCASAISVKSPDSNTVWASGTSGQTVSWEAVSTDATSFVIQLVNQAGFLTNSPVTLVANQSTGSPNVINSATVTFPNGNWPVGTAFQINLMSSSNTGAAILAQSNQFNITSSGSTSSTSGSSSSSSSASSPTTITTGTMTTGSTATTVTSTTGGDASGGIPNSASSSKSAGDIVQPGKAMSMIIALAGILGVFA